MPTDYQKFMRGIDRGDQMMGYYNVGRLSRKWWKRVFSYLIEVCLLNAYVLHKLSDEVQADFLQFRLDLADWYCTEASTWSPSKH